MLDLGHCFKARGVEGFGKQVEWFLEEEGAWKDEGGSFEVSQFVGRQLLVDFPRNVNFEIDFFFIAKWHKVMLSNTFLNLVISLLKFHTKYKIIHRANTHPTPTL